MLRDYISKVTRKILENRIAKNITSLVLDNYFYKKPIKIF